MAGIAIVMSWQRISTAGLGIGIVLAATMGRGQSPPANAPDWIRHPEKAFSVSATEVTVAQFRACVEAGACEGGATNPLCNYGKTDRDDHPVNCVTFVGAEQYCRWIGARLCTETEWLDACRGTEARAFPYGSTFDVEVCNTQSHTIKVDGRALSTSPVRSYRRCEGGLAGLFDMAGNVAEWVDSCHGDYCKFRGAGYLSNDPVDRFAACGAVCSGNDKGFQSGIVGIRCCKDAAE